MTSWLSLCGGIHFQNPAVIYKAERRRASKDEARPPPGGSNDSHRGFSRFKTISGVSNEGFERLGLSHSSFNLGLRFCVGLGC